MFRCAAWLLLPLWLVATDFVHAGVQGTVAYDKGKDQLTLEISEQPLADVLAEIGRLSAIDIKFDPAAAGKVSARVQKLPLEQGLQRISGKLNVIKAYRKVKVGKTDRNLLVAMTVLPAGQTDVARAVRLIAEDKEIEYRAGVVAQYQARAADRLDYMERRWTSRLGQLNPQQRQRYEALMKKAAERAAAQAKMSESHRQRQEERARQRAERHGDEPQPAFNPELAKKAKAQFAQPDTPAFIPDEK